MKEERATLGGVCIVNRQICWRRKKRKAYLEVKWY